MNDFYTLFLFQENDWSVLKCVLENLPVLLQNKTLVLSAKSYLVDDLCSVLCAMVSQQNPRHCVTCIWKLTYRVTSVCL